MSDEHDAMERIRDRCRRLYGVNSDGHDQADECCDRIIDLIERFKNDSESNSRVGWDERDVVLITYGDQVQHQPESPLATLREFLVSRRLHELIRVVHILPFCPYSSDDGFSVIDYRAVDPLLGGWDDVRELGTSFELMFDLVLNHASKSCRWFQEYLAGHPPYDGYFIDEDPASDLSDVTRPRSHPLLTPFETDRGTKHVWTTFSDDQVDLNFASPDVLIEMLEIFLFYIEQGARIIRLDAIAYLWKRVGTTCIHLPETHEVVKLFRDVIDEAAPHVILLTETNVPHKENVSYFGDNDEAQLVYQFSLPPLLLDAMLSGDASSLANWLSDLEPTKPGTGFLNFTASHDGIGVRPLEGLVSSQRVEQLANAVKVRGGMVSTRRQPDGSESPYELNISYFSALEEPDGQPSEAHVRRFLTTQGLMLSLRGIPAIYLHSLFGTPNDLAGVKESGHPRRINRRKFQLDEIESKLNERDSVPAAVLAGYRQLLSVRIEQPAFHPDANQDIWILDNPALIAFVRKSVDGQQALLVLANVSDQEQHLDVFAFTDLRFDHDLLTGQTCESARPISVPPFGLLWLTRFEA